MTRSTRIRILERGRDPHAVRCLRPHPGIELGGGFHDLEVRVIDTRGGTMVITTSSWTRATPWAPMPIKHRRPKDCAAVPGMDGRASQPGVLSNLADRRLARARCVSAHGRHR